MMVKEMLCSMPLPFKALMGKTATAFNREKRAAIRELLGSAAGDDAVHTSKYKRDLKSCIETSKLTAQETRAFLTGLYKDEILPVHQERLQPDLPVVVGVMKDESDKLDVFFDHYGKIGKFNYVLIDNGSSDDSVQRAIDHGATVYSCRSPFDSMRKLGWLNRVYAGLPNGVWTLQLDADELLVYDGYESLSFNEVIERFQQTGISCAAAVMIDMFSCTAVPAENYIENYLYFENVFHEEKSFFFNSIYGGIRERVFAPDSSRSFLIKKHPVVRKKGNTILINNHYLYPFQENFGAVLYFGLLHYKLFDNEIEKYKRIAEMGNYHDGSKEYKLYIETLSRSTYEELFYIGEHTVKFNGTDALRQITCLQEVGECKK